MDRRVILKDKAIAIGNYLVRVGGNAEVTGVKVYVKPAFMVTGAGLLGPQGMTLDEFVLQGSLGQGYV